MNVKELIDTYQKEITDINELKSQKYVDDKCLETAVSWIERFVEDLEGLSNVEYNRKVKIPEFVAEFIEQKKKVTIYLGQIFRRAYNWGNKDEKVDNWLAHGNNHETFARAWLDGYEIEEEPKYWVKCNDSYLSFVTFSHKSASEIETSPDYLEAILFTFKPQADHMALLVNGTVEEVNNG